LYHENTALCEQKHTYHEPKHLGQGGGVNLAGKQPVYHEISRLQQVWTGVDDARYTRIIHSRLCCNLHI